MDKIIVGNRAIMKATEKESRLSFCLRCGAKFGFVDYNLIEIACS